MNRTPDDDFGAAFADLTGPNATGEPGETMVVDPPVENPPAESVPPPEEPVEVPPEEAPPAGEPPVEEASPETAPTEKPKPTDEEAEATLQRLAELVSKRPAAEPAQAPAHEATTPVDETPLYTPEEQKILDSYEKEWSDVSQAESLKRRAEYRGLLEYAFTEIMREFQPIKEMAQAVATRTHYADIKETVGDYSDEERSQIIDWVDKQPPYLQQAYKSVIQEGTAGEVADLVNRYRTEMGTAKQAVAPKSGGDTELSSEAKQAAAALAPVGSKRSVVQQPDDLSSFDAGWKKFADMV